MFPYSSYSTAFPNGVAGFYSGFPAFPAPAQGLYPSFTGFPSPFFGDHHGFPFGFPGNFVTGNLPTAAKADPIQVVRPTPIAGKVTRLIGTTDINGKGTSHSVSNVGPFILLDNAIVPPGQKAPAFGMHPHAGLTACTLVLNGSVDHRDNRSSFAGRNDTGAIMLVRSNRGVWHEETPIDAGEKWHVQQLWLLTPPKARRSLSFVDVNDCCAVKWSVHNCDEAGIPPITVRHLLGGKSTLSSGWPCVSLLEVLGVSPHEDADLDADDCPIVPKAVLVGGGTCHGKLALPAPSFWDDEEPEVWPQGEVPVAFVVATQGTAQVKVVSTGRQVDIPEGSIAVFGPGSMNNPDYLEVTVLAGGRALIGHGPEFAAETITTAWHKILVQGGAVVAFSREEALSLPAQVEREGQKFGLPEDGEQTPLPPPPVAGLDDDMDDPN